MALSYDEAVAQISGPGSPFETVEELINGVPFRVFKNAPPNLRGVFDGARLDENIFLVYEDEEWSYKKVMEHAVGDLTKIAGQKPVVTKSKKAIAGFKIRDGVPIGCMVTLRGVRMYEFLDRFVTIALPRVRDFRGISARSFDGRGNYNIGVKEQIIFPEIEYDKIDAIRGMNISITTSAKTDEECKALLAAFKFPFKN